MKRAQTFGLIVIVFCLIAAFPAAAPAQDAKPRLFVLHQEVVRPDRVEAYEAATKEFVATVRQHQKASPQFHFNTVQGDDFTYSFVLPLADLTSLEAINQGFGALAQAVGEAKFADLMKRSGATYEWTDESLLIEEPGMSYAPANPRLKPEEGLYLHFDLYYVQPGREAEADALAKQFVALFTQKAVPDGYRLVKVLLGKDMPLYVVVVSAKDAADFAARDAANRQTLGKEGEALFARAAALCRRIDHYGGRVRPDLSVLQPAP
jgi:hypothetical protein